MASEEQTVTKELLESVHRRQLVNGKTNNDHQEAIIKALGGIDDILQHLLRSNVILDQPQLNSLHRIIINTAHKNQRETTINALSQPQEFEDNKYHQTYTYTFKEEDSLLFSIFGQENANKILHALNGKIVKSILVLLLGVWLVLGLLTLYGLSWDVYFIYWSFLAVLSSSYILVWILYLNKEAMKLVLKQFEFWFKIFYLIQYLIANAILSSYYGDPPYLTCTYFIFFAALLFIVMIFDAINTKKSNKLMISSVAVAVFAWRALDLMYNAFYGDPYGFEKATSVTIHLPYFDDKATISIVDICSNSAQILAIFLFKQLISTIRKPNQALVIKTRPFIEYENNKETVSTIKKLKHWRRATIVFWAVFLLFCIFFL
eukprot:195325_1